MTNYLNINLSLQNNAFYLFLRYDISDLCINILFYSGVDLNLVFSNNDILELYINVFNLFLGISIIGSVFCGLVRPNTECRQKVVVLL